jgi:LysR family transcriptional regulator, regulator for bpeEF and oprC
MLLITSGDGPAGAMIDPKSLAIFVKVAERRSFAQAARELAITQSGVSNAVSRLEERLGVRLLARTTRRVNVTEDGAAFLDHCKRILAELDEAEKVLSRARLTPAGRLRVDAPVAFGRLKVVPLLGTFRTQYPDVTLALSYTDRFVDLIEEGIDIAVRMGVLQDSSLIARRLMQTQFRVYGAPGYFAKHGRPRTLDDLKKHNCLAFTLRETRLIRDWRFRRGKAEVTMTPRGDMSFSDGAAVCAAACAGYGLAQMHDYYGEGPVADGVLEPVLQRFEPAADAVWLVYPPTRHLSPKVRVFVDFLTAQLRPRRRAVGD